MPEVHIIAYHLPQSHSHTDLSSSKKLLGEFTQIKLIPQLSHHLRSNLNTSNFPT